MLFYGSLRKNKGSKFLLDKQFLMLKYFAGLFFVIVSCCFAPGVDMFLFGIFAIGCVSLILI